MKTVVKFWSVAILINVSLVISTFAQKGVEDGSRFGHGEDSINCLRNYSIYKEYFKQNNYADAIGPWRQMYRECPASYENMYIDGIKMYKTFIDKEKDAAKQAALLDTLEMVYNQRVKYFKKEGEMVGRFAYDFLMVRRSDINDVAKGYGLLEKSIDLEKNKSLSFVVSMFFTSTALLYSNQKLTADQVIQNYTKASDIIDARLKAKPDDAEWTKVKEAVDQNFAASKVASCETLVGIFEPKFKQNPDDIDLVKKIIKMLSDNNCNKTNLYEQVVERQYKAEPSAKAAFDIANMFYAKEKYDKAVEYYKQAIEKETEATEKAKYNNILGNIYLSVFKQGETAKRYALEALKLRSAWGEPYLLIGKSYILARESCGSNDFERNAIFWVAVDKFVQAKNVDASVADEANNLISTYSKHFPNNENAFFYGIKPGDTYKVGCWINENTTARF
jgi:tetratricopeptide (TPR) repeat protein